MSNKKYRLLKDVDSPELTAKSGSIGELDTATGRVWFDNKRFFFNLSTIQMQPDWFQEVVEPERVNISSFGRIFEAVKIGNGFSYGFYSNKEIFPSQYQAIKQAIEAALNGEVLYSIEDVRKALHGEWGTENAVGSVVNRLKNYKK